MKRLVFLGTAAALACAAGCFEGVFADDYRTCSSDPDCQNGERCLMTGTGAVCVTAQDSRCSSNASCPTGTACGADGACRTVCDASGAARCLVGQSCKDAVCVGNDARHDPAAGGGDAGSAGAGGVAMGGAGGVAAGAGAGGGVAGTGGSGGKAGTGSAGSGGKAGTGGATAGSGGGGSGGNANPCSVAADCEKCCDSSGTGITAYRNFVLNACGCDATVCFAECSGYCAAPAFEDPPCSNCVSAIPASASCKVAALSKCDTNPACKAYRACVDAAHCK